MTYTFYRPEIKSGRILEDIVDKVKQDYMELLTGNVPYSDQVTYFTAAVKAGVALVKDENMMFWGLDEPQNMPADCRVIFFYNPTYYTVAMMIYGITHNPKLLKDVEGLAECFKKGLLASTGRSMNGAGYDAELGLMDALEIFANAGAHNFIATNPNLCPTFNQCYLDGFQFLQNRISTNTAITDRGEDYSKRAKKLLASNQQ